MFQHAIEKKRKQMFITAQRHGIASRKTLIVSQQLDRLIYLTLSHKQSHR